MKRWLERELLAETYCFACQICFACVVNWTDSRTYFGLVFGPLKFTSTTLDLNKGVALHKWHICENDIEREWIAVEIYDWGRDFRIWENSSIWTHARVVVVGSKGIMQSTWWCRWTIICIRVSAHSGCCHSMSIDRVHPFAFCVKGRVTLWSTMWEDSSGSRWIVLSELLPVARHSDGTEIGQDSSTTVDDKTVSAAALGLWSVFEVFDECTYALMNQFDTWFMVRPVSLQSVLFSSLRWMAY